MSIESCAKCGHASIDTDHVDPYIAGVPFCVCCAAEIEDQIQSHAEVSEALGDHQSSVKAARDREQAFDQWWMLGITNGVLPKHPMNLAREAYYAAWIPYSHRTGYPDSAPARDHHYDAMMRALEGLHDAACETMDALITNERMDWDKLEQAVKSARAALAGAK